MSGKEKGGADGLSQLKKSGWKESLNKKERKRGGTLRSKGRPSARE